MTWDLDSAGHAAVVLLERQPAFDELEEVVLVRDLRGRVRIVWRPSAGRTGPDRSASARVLADALKGWFAGPILSTGDGPAGEREVARQLVARATPFGQPWVKEPATGARVQVREVWRQLIHRAGKRAWLEGPPVRPAWPLRAQTPSIVAFHSFKGGVGRSTALAVCAWQLARAGERVLCVDLDLESPGLDHVLAAPADLGVIDLLVAALVGAARPISDAIVTATVHGADIDLLPAGVMNRSYVEKLAHLDLYGQAEGEAPVREVLQSMLEEARRLGYRWILIDNRSGLSDLAGVTLTALAHVDVLVARGNGQGAAGLRLTTGLLAPRRPPEEHRTLVVHALAPLPLDGELSRHEQAGLRHAAHAAFLESYYNAIPDPPGADDPTAHHHPLPLPALDEIRAAEALPRVSASTLQHPAFLALTDRIRELAGPEEA